MGKKRRLVFLVPMWWMPVGTTDVWWCHLVCLSVRGGAIAKCAQFSGL